MLARINITEAVTQTKADDGRLRVPVIVTTELSPAQSEQARELDLMRAGDEKAIQNFRVRQALDDHARTARRAARRLSRKASAGRPRAVLVDPVRGSTAGFCDGYEPPVWPGAPDTADHGRHRTAKVDAVVPEDEAFVGSQKKGGSNLRQRPTQRVRLS